MLTKSLQTKPQVKDLNICYYNLNYTVVKTRDENKDIGIPYENDENDENDYINFIDFKTPNLFVGIKPHEILR